MRILISPAKKMKEDPDSLEPTALPVFLSEAEQIQQVLQAMTPQELQTLWNCNDAIAKTNIARLRSMDLRQRLTPAILCYEGIQYQYMAPGVFEDGEYGFIQEHLRILSGFYGILRPFDGVVPYRLEMQAKLSIGPHKNLYGFWGDKLARTLEQETDFILNLASKEYSKGVLPHLSAHTQVLTCVFGQLIQGKVVEKGTLCKMARGHMVRWLAQNRVTHPQEIAQFGDLGYRFDPSRSTASQYIFLQE